MDVLIDGDIVLHGTVGEELFFEGFSSVDVIEALARIGRNNPVKVRINSPGGIATEGVAIFNALEAHSGRVTCIVEAIAASAASLIAMAGDETIMCAGSVMMIHDPAGFTMGNAADHEKSIECLDALGDSYAEVYATKTGKPAAEIRDLMREEIWLTASEAVAEGFADRVGVAQAGEAVAFNYRLFRDAPKQMVALADARGWSKRKPKAASAVAHRQLEIPMATQTAEEKPATNEEAIQAAAVKAGNDATARASEIASMCSNGGVPAMAATLIREGVTIDDAQKRIDGAKDIRAAVDLARKSCAAIKASAADTYISAGASIEKVRSDLFAKMTAAQEATSINSSHQIDRIGSGDEAAELAAKAVALHRGPAASKRSQ